jgi:hypothetical protein
MVPISRPGNPPASWQWRDAGRSSALLWCIAGHHLEAAGRHIMNRTILAGLLAIFPLSAAQSRAVWQMPPVCLKADGKTPESCQLRQCRALGISCYEAEPRQHADPLPSNAPSAQQKVCGATASRIRQAVQGKTNGDPCRAGDHGGHVPENAIQPDLGLRLYDIGPERVRCHYGSAMT